MPLTRIQQRILDFITHYIETRGCSPSLREIAEGVGYKTGEKNPGGGALSYQLNQLKGKYIEWQPNRPRTIRVIDDGVSASPASAAVPSASPPSIAEPSTLGTEDVAMVPMLGNIAAGKPILTPQDPMAAEQDLARQDIQFFFSLPRQLVGFGPLFLARVKGDSMVNAGILDDDWVVVHQQPTADDGQTVAALIEDEATVKVLRRHAGHVWLMPQQPNPEPIPGDEASILGVVVAVLRSLRPAR
jgi:repressor LexA